MLMQSRNGASRVMGAGFAAALAILLLAGCHRPAAQSAAQGSPGQANASQADTGQADTGQADTGQADTGQPAATQVADNTDSCAEPAPWNPPGAKPGQPNQEFSACLKDQAYAIRNLDIPLQSAMGGIIAQCQVQVDKFEGSMVLDNAMAPEQDQQAAEQAAETQATAAVTQYRRCVGHG